jgi:hypothetical protein
MKTVRFVKMRSYLARASVLLPLAGLCLLAQAQTARTYRGSCTGTAARSLAGGRTTFVGQVADALPGYLTLTVDFDPGGSVSGGHWTLTVTGRKDDGSASEEGRLEGTLSGGSVTLGEDGKVSSLDALRLTIKSGRGTYAGIVSGEGAFKASPVSGKTAPFGGALTLTF